MTIEQCEQRNNAILQAWREWKNGENILTSFDCAVLAAIFGIRFPLACQRFLEATEGKYQARTTAPNRRVLETIFRFLSSLYEQRDPSDSVSENKLIGVCECCGSEIYEGEEYAIIDGCYYCDYCGGEDGLTISELKEQNGEQEVEL